MDNQKYIENLIWHMRENFICESLVKDNFTELSNSFDSYKKIFNNYMSKCKSPIEKIMCSLLFQLEICFEPQAKIEQYTVDFLIDNSTRDKTRYIIIECDGHEFHEKTKDQAKHDKERDRFLQVNGYQVYRFTGSEIFNNPLKVLLEIEDIVYRMV